MSNDYHKDSNPETGKFDKFMENYFLDPNTSLLDQLTFRVDLYECDEEYVVEALFDETKPEKIHIKVNNEQLIIAAFPKIQNKAPMERTVPFPFSINNKKIIAGFSNDILEIKISKISDAGPPKKEMIIICNSKG
ncbi:Hsp20/alpha crystallin family protein [Peribacillus cavernae]|uniref:Hsp20/alpha crystallin family protein n=1 Tax=Peribacillus cavernae TaxID=1674310 RepID=A0A433HI11_9BACI|nr:Hsp20/alpha crystallin family protein [Peribacillus cavernae]MDQ0220502.1 HSP20 family molecular chaperone IbpA [Peribacillus cavernae]RUQ28004.1 Hsp20/alpha crystallin family protein [Peribacillus cavernae]